MTTNYVTIIITNPLIYNSEDKKNKNHSNSKNLLKNMHNFCLNMKTKSLIYVNRFNKIQFNIFELFSLKF